MCVSHNLHCLAVGASTALAFAPLRMRMAGGAKVTAPLMDTDDIVTLNEPNM